MKDFEKKRVLITGAASGIGRDLAQLFAERRATLILVDKNKELLEKVALALRDLGAEVILKVVDLTESQAISNLKSEVDTQIGALDLLINNAGIVFGGEFLEVKTDRHLQTFRVNLESLVLMTHAFLPGLLSKKESHIVNMSSATGLVGVPYGTSYAASKWAVIGFTESLRQELAQLGHQGVNFTLVCPSTVDTGLFSGTTPPRLIPLLHSMPLAKKIIRAIEKKQFYLREPFLIKFVPFLNGVLARVAREWLLRFLGVTTAMKTWRGRS